jgi:hypothetical protein
MGCASTLLLEIVLLSAASRFNPPEAYRVLRSPPDGNWYFSVGGSGVVAVRQPVPSLLSLNGSMRVMRRRGRFTSAGLGE